MTTLFMNQLGNGIIEWEQNDGQNHGYIICLQLSAIPYLSVDMCWVLSTLESKLHWGKGLLIVLVIGIFLWHKKNIWNIEHILKK